MDLWDTMVAQLLRAGPIYHATVYFGWRSVHQKEFLDKQVTIVACAGRVPAAHGIIVTKSLDTRIRFRKSICRFFVP